MVPKTIPVFIVRVVDTAEPLEPVADAAVVAVVVEGLEFQVEEHAYLEEPRRGDRLVPDGALAKEEDGHGDDADLAGHDDELPVVEAVPGEEEPKAPRRAVLKAVPVVEEDHEGSQRDSAP